MSDRSEPSNRAGRRSAVGRRLRGAAGAVMLAAATTALLVPAPPARAATETERLDALRDLQEGNRLFDAGDYLAALARFESAYAKVPSPKLFFNFGQVHRRLGRTVEALDFYERYLAETPNPPSKLRAEAQQRSGELQKVVATIEIRSDAAGHEVSVDGHSYGPTPLQRAVRVLPGAHQIVVVRSGPSASGAPPFVEKVVAQAGQRITVDAHVGAPGVAPTQTATPPADGARVSESVATPAAPVRRVAASDSASSSTGASAPGVATVSGSPGAREGGDGAHSGRFGLRLRADVDRTLAGAGVAGALDYGILEQLAVSAGGFRWPVEGQPVYGASAGVMASFLRGAVRPLLAIEAQVYFQQGAGADASTSAHLGAHAAVGVQWDVADHAGLYAMAGGQYTSTEIGAEDGKLFFVPSLGLHLRL